jgi:Glycosyl transferase family 2
MKFASVTYAKNEGDIIESFVRHQLSYMDYVVVVDHDSVDRTGHILQSLVHEGLPLIVLNDKSPQFHQATRTAQLVTQTFSRLPVDFVFPLDADEFLRVSSRAQLEANIAAITNEHVGQLLWRNYVVSETDDANEFDPVRRLQHRAAAEPHQQFKAIIGRHHMSIPNLGIAPGNHYLYEGQTNGRQMSGVTLSDASIAHYPLRSAEHATLKIVLGWLSSRAQDPKKIPSHTTAAKGVGAYWHNRAMFAQWLESPDFSIQCLQESAWRYYVSNAVDTTQALDAIDLVHDPLPISHTLRYTERSATDPLRALARWTDQLLSSL